MAIRTLTDSLFIDPVSVDSVFVDPVIDAGAQIHCVAATAPAAGSPKDERVRQQHLQQALAVHYPQSPPGLRPEWMQARAALRAMTQPDAGTIAPEPLGNSPCNQLH